MGTGDYVALGVIVVILAAAIIYVVKKKKSGAKCIGCSAGCKACGDAKNKSNCCCGCNTQKH